MLRPVVAAVLAAGAVAVQASWMLEASPTSERLRGVGAVSDTVAWASGNKGTVARTIDGGRTWTPIGDEGFHAISIAPRGGTAWAVGEGGRVASLSIGR